MRTPEISRKDIDNIKGNGSRVLIPIPNQPKKLQHSIKISQEENVCVV
jgi:hypothetical protein